KFGQELFQPPEPAKAHIAFVEQQERLRMRELADPTKKMSKSDASGEGAIFLGEDPESAARKVISATTDRFGEIRFDMEKRPGVSNLLQILAVLESKPLDETIKEFEGQTQYGPLKQRVAEAVTAFLAGFQTKMSSVDED